MRVLVLDTVDSTNTYAMAHFDELADRILVSAREQTSGRGRLGRKWVAPPGGNLTVSLAMSRVASGFHAGAVAGLAVLDLVREAVPAADPYLKWPNDVYCGDAKLSGILCEGRIAAGKLAGVVAGIGVNVNFSPADAGRIDQRATSLKILAPEREFPPEALCRRLAFFLERWYIKSDCNCEAVLASWRGENRLIGREIAVVEPSGKELHGRFSAIDADGSMVLETASGRRIFRCGDVKIAKGFSPRG